MRYSEQTKPRNANSLIFLNIRIIVLYIYVFTNKLEFSQHFKFVYVLLMQSKSSRWSIVVAFKKKIKQNVETYEEINRKMLLKQSCNVTNRKQQRNVSLSQLKHINMKMSNSKYIFRNLFKHTSVWFTNYVLWILIEIHIKL